MRRLIVFVLATVMLLVFSVNPALASRGVHKIKYKRDIIAGATVVHVETRAIVFHYYSSYYGKWRYRVIDVDMRAYDKGNLGKPVYIYLRPSVRLDNKKKGTTSYKMLWDGDKHSTISYFLQNKVDFDKGWKRINNYPINKYVHGEDRTRIRVGLSPIWPRYLNGPNGDITYSGLGFAW